MSLVHNRPTMSQYPQFDRASNHAPLSDEELQAFDDLLAALQTDGAMNVEGVDGFLTAMFLGPSQWLDRWPTADWLPLVWGGDGPDGQPFASGRQRKRATLLALRHLQSIAVALRDHPAQWEPLFSVVEGDGEEWTEAQDWCLGFLQAVDLDPAEWQAWCGDAEFAPVMHTIRMLAGDEEPDAASEHAGALDDPAARDALASEVAQGILALSARVLAARKASSAGG